MIAENIKEAMRKTANHLVWKYVLIRSPSDVVYGER